MAFTCPRCGRTSQHPEDEANGYCGACHAFTGDGGTIQVVMNPVVRKAFETWLYARHMVLARIGDTDPDDLPTYVAVFADPERGCREPSP